ncbi:MAG: two-component system CheB/CheR fusion protein [Cyclobacteriaceae bacterium]|jgi:two-component system CheB/CheR fusion protein
MKKQTSTPTQEQKVKTIEQAGIDYIPIVGLGSSAGGLEALEQFFQAMPSNTGMAFVVIQHLAPNHKGILPELLQRLTQMKVYQASDQLLVKPNSVYVIPPNKSLTLFNGSLLLFDPVESRGLRLPIDIFFRSLADDQGEKSIGVVLSGMGSDGSKGLKSIKEKNGTALVQEPSTAKFDSMPSTAINAVVVDSVAAASELPGKLISLLKLSPQAKQKHEAKSNIDKIIFLIRDELGSDFSLYKRTTLFRRIERRKNVHEIHQIQNYVRFLQENPKEIKILFKELLIGVTSFFRDTAVWDKLRDDIFPALLEDAPDGHVFRAWVPACSTGEEAYSIAIIFKEVMGKVKNYKNLSLQIFATDIDNEAIDKARKAYFSEDSISNVSPERIREYFTREGEGYRIKTSIREMVVFATQDVTKDPPFTKLDLLSCRNMLIYVETELQKKLLTLFNYSLNPGGIMVLGTAETLGSQTEKFEELDTRLKIFKSVALLPRSELINLPSSFRPSKPAKEKRSTPSKEIENIQGLADQILLQRFAPASVLVNSKGDILYITGRTGKYLEPVAGKANWNIYAMAQKGLNHELPGAFRKALRNFDPVQLRNLEIGNNGDTHNVDVIIQQMENPATVRGMIMVVFTDVTAKHKLDALGAKTNKIISATHQSDLEMDLKRSVEDIQSLREQMQTSQEELKSTNEELQSTNEELQSTNEELTTSKEEMQSLNEELQTVNVELQSKVSDFVNANDDMENLLNSTEIATLFIDKELNIRRFTDNVSEIFKIRDTDIGRPFTDLVSILKYINIASDGKQVIKTLKSIEKEIQTDDGKWFKIQIMPYRTSDDRIDGLVLTFVDITKPKELEIALQESIGLMRSFINNVNKLVIVLSSEGIIMEFNPEAEKVFGYKRSDVIGKIYSDMFVSAELRKNVNLDLRSLIEDDKNNCFQHYLLSSSGDQLHIEWSAHKMYDENGSLSGIITLGENILKL